MLVHELCYFTGLQMQNQIWTNMAMDKNSFPSKGTCAGKQNETRQETNYTTLRKLGS